MKKKYKAEKTKTIQNKILSHGEKTFGPTLAIYREALTFIIDVLDKEFVSSLDDVTTKDCVNITENLIHRTKNNPTPKYDFSNQFYKFPSYFRRSAISKALGILKSYRSNLANWEEERKQTIAEGKRFKKKPPALNIDHEAFPVFYEGNMFERLSENQAKIKLFKGNDWVWETITFNPSNMKNRGVEDWKENNPTLVKVGKKYFLSISYTKKIKLNKTSLKDQIIVSVDLGLTNSAVCSAMDYNGTVIGRTFINQPVEKDRLVTKTNRLKKAQRTSGYISAPAIWRRINGIQKYIIQNTASRIIKFAELHNADVIVFEY